MPAVIPDGERPRVVSALLGATVGSMVIAESVRDEHPRVAHAVEVVVTSYASLVALFWALMQAGYEE